MNRNRIVAYVAGPYSGDIEGNIKRAEKVSIDLIRKGYSVITPHKNTAHYEKYEGEGINRETWIEMDLAILRRCDILFVMEGYEGSKGTAGEIKFATENNIPVIFLNKKIMSIL